MLTSSNPSSLPPQLDMVPPEQRIKQCSTWLFSVIGALLLIFGLYLVSGEISPSRIELQMGWPPALAGILLLAYDVRRRSSLITLVAAGGSIGVYRRGRLSRTAGIHEFIHRDSRFSPRALFNNPLSLKLVLLSILAGAGAAFGAVVFLSEAAFGHFYSLDASSLRERIFALLSAVAMLAFIVNLVMAGFYRVEVTFTPAEPPAEGFELLFPRDVTRVFRNQV
ncbi:MAG: hypothetical protein LAP21_06395 [Acidobacteriia bacterium]|nr:hypothetical protein [Terriglobia bacterium]